MIEYYESHAYDVAAQYPDFRELCYRDTCVFFNCVGMYGRLFYFLHHFR